MSEFPTNPELEAAVVANADEDTPRLAYADWLDEHGDPDRAEFIRAQIALANGTPADANWAENLEREAELLLGTSTSSGPVTWRAEDRKRQEELLHPKCPPLPEPFFFPTSTRPDRDRVRQDFSRGFPFFAIASLSPEECDPGRLAEDLTTVFETTTIRGLGLLDFASADFLRLLEVPAMAKLRGLDLTADRTPDLRAAMWKKLLELPGRRLEVLQDSDAPLTADVLNVMAAASPFGLRRFCVPEFRATPAEVRGWFAGGWAQTLRYADTRLSDEPQTAEAVADGLAALPELHSLCVGPAIAEQLLRSGDVRCFPKLGALTLALNTTNFRKLLEADWFARLRLLDLRGGLGDQAVRALAKHPVAKVLRGLWLDGNRLGEAGLRAISGGAFPELTVLGLDRQWGPGEKGLPPDEVRAFVSTLTAPKLKRLDLSHSPLGNSGAKVLAANPGLPNLTHLKVESCGLTRAGKRALEESPHFRATVRCPEVK